MSLELAPEVLTYSHAEAEMLREVREYRLAFHAMEAAEVPAPRIARLLIEAEEQAAKMFLEAEVAIIRDSKGRVRFRSA